MKYRNKKILIVDDEPKNLKILRIRLGTDYEIKEVSSGEEALEMIETFRPALVLLDIMMDGIDGYEVTKRIKRDPKIKICKVILVSGKAMIEEKLEGYRAGAEDYITKPFNGEELKAKVEVFLKLYNLESELNELNKSLEAEVQVRSEQLLKSERMAFVGMNAGEIVHNLKTPISVIKLYLHQIKKSHPELQEVDRIGEATGKLLETIKNILTSFNRDIKSEMSELLVNDVISEELDFLKNLDSEYKYNIETKLALQSSNKVHGAVSHISQIVGNLIKNSIEAMHDSKEKKLFVTTADVDNAVTIKIRDTGAGIKPENIEKVFDPLFTTKDGSDGGPVGNGLGLSYCKKMIETYGGELEITSELGRGTEVTIKLPARSGQQDKKAA